MAHYAFLNSNNVVTEVIVGRDENDTTNGVTDWEAWYGNYRGQVCKRTSYNTSRGVHVFGGVPFRKNYAAIGMIYDEMRDAFMQPQPFPSWILDEDSCVWNPPIPYPSEGYWIWSEEEKNWVHPE